jgi:hypothetical protein
LRPSRLCGGWGRGEGSGGRIGWVGRALCYISEICEEVVRERRDSITVEDLSHGVAVRISDFRVDEAGASLREHDALHCFA